MEKINQQIAVDNVKSLLKIIPEAFAVYGTALGIIREGGIIEHDLDTDIGIMSEHFKWEQITEAIQRGFAIITIYGTRYHGLEVSLRRGGVKTDIMVMYEKNEMVENILWDNGGRNGASDEIIHRYPIEIMEPQNALLNGEVVQTLGTKYIEYVYGEDWQTPKTEWDWRTDHKCKI